MIGRIGNLVRRVMTRQDWFLGYRSAGDPTGEFRFVVPPRQHFLADPFLFSCRGRKYLFAEDYVFSQRKGVISVGELDDHGGLVTWQECLTRPYHLSYPCVFSWQGEVFMVPETRGNRSIELYRAEDFPRSWRLEKTLFADVEAVDATLFQVNDRWWMFVALADEHGNASARLHLFHAESPLGPWYPHASNPVITGMEHARPAGMVIEKDGMIIRPAQDCAIRYGHRVVFHRIDELSPDRYRETRIGSIEPEWLEGNLGTHTYQLAVGFEAVDARFRVPRGPFDFPVHFRQKPWPFGTPWKEMAQR